MADSQLILELLFLHRRGGCSLTVLLFFLMLVGTCYCNRDLFSKCIFPYNYIKAEHKIKCCLSMHVSSTILKQCCDLGRYFSNTSCVNLGCFSDFCTVVPFLLHECNGYLRLTSSQPRERVDRTIYYNANEFFHTILFAGYRDLFV